MFPDNTLFAIKWKDTSLLQLIRKQTENAVVLFTFQLIQHSIQLTITPYYHNTSPIITLSIRPTDSSQ